MYCGEAVFIFTFSEQKCFCVNIPLKCSNNASIMHTVESCFFIGFQKIAPLTELKFK